MYLLFINESCSGKNNFCNKINLQPTYIKTFSNFSYVLLDDKSITDSISDEKIKELAKNLDKLIEPQYFIVGFKEFYLEPSTIVFISSNIWKEEWNFVYNSLFYLTRLLLLRFSFIHELTSIYLSSVSSIVRDRTSKINMLRYHFDYCKIYDIIKSFIGSNHDIVNKHFNNNSGFGIITFGFSNNRSSFVSLFDEILRGLEGCVGGSG